MASAETWSGSKAAIYAYPALAIVIAPRIVFGLLAVVLIVNVARILATILILLGVAYLCLVIVAPSLIHRPILSWRR